MGIRLGVHAFCCLQWRLEACIYQRVGALVFWPTLLQGRSVLSIEVPRVLHENLLQMPARIGLLI